MANALEDVQQTYLSLADSYLVLRAACTTDDQRAALDTQYNAAQKAYYLCADKMLADDDAAVAVLSQELKDANAEVAKAVEQMGDISKVIDGITDAVTKGAQLLAQAGLVAAA